MLPLIHTADWQLGNGLADRAAVAREEAEAAVANPSRVTQEADMLGRAHRDITDVRQAGGALSKNTRAMRDARSARRMRSRSRMVIIDPTRQSQRKARPARGYALRSGK